MSATSTVFDLDEGGERNVRLRDLQATAAVCLVLVSGVTTTPGFAQQQAAPTQTVSNPTTAAPPAPTQNDTTGNPALPQAPAPKLTRAAVPAGYGQGLQPAQEPFLESAGAVHADQCAAAAVGQYAAAG